MVAAANLLFGFPLSRSRRAARPKWLPHSRWNPSGRVESFVVDDNVDAAEMLAEALRYAGHDVREEHDGSSALAAVTEFRPDVILLDLGLPGMDGFEVARRLRADSSLAKARVIAITGYGQDVDRRRTAQLGIERHLVKPVDLDTVIEAVGA